MSSLSLYCERMTVVAQALCTRAVLRLGGGDAKGAWEDVLATHRLARLVAKQQTLLDTLVDWNEVRIARNNQLDSNGHATAQFPTHYRCTWLKSVLVGQVERCLTIYT